jgi:uncharacterized coiled-coil DUF342 family protein
MYKRLDELRARAEKAAPAAKAKLVEQMDALHQKMAPAREKLKELQDAAEKAWEHLKSELGKSLADFKKSGDQPSSPEK